MIEFKHEFKDLHNRLTTQISHIVHEEDLSDIMQEFRRFLLGIGFHPDSVAQYIEAE